MTGFSFISSLNRKIEPGVPFIDFATYWISSKISFLSSHSLLFLRYIFGPLQ